MGGGNNFSEIGPSACCILQGYIEYSSRPHNYRICRADRYMRNFSNPENIKGVEAPQHGSFLRLTKDEYERLQAWSDKWLAQLSKY